MMEQSIVIYPNKKLQMNYTECIYKNSVNMGMMKKRLKLEL